MPPARVLVTGAGGFLGSHVVRSLAETDAAVVAALRPGSDSWRLRDLSPRVSLTPMEMRRPESIRSALEEGGPDTVIHCAAHGVSFAEQDPRLMMEVNILGSFELLETCAAKGVHRFLHLGSCFEYGNKDHAVREDEVLSPTTGYGSTKAAASIVMAQRARDLGMDLVVLRPFGLWGPREASHRLVPQVVAACLARSALELTRCEQVRDYSFVTDMADLIAATALSRDFPAGESVNLASGEAVVLRDFVLRIARALGGEDLMRFGALPYRRGEMRNLVADVRKQHALLGPMKRTPIPDGLRRTIAAAPRR